MPAAAGSSAFARPENLVIVACLFTGPEDRRVRENARRFRESAEATGRPLRVAEASTDGVFTLATGPGDLRIDAGPEHRLWQKERLLAAAIASLGPEVDAIAWVDADVLLPPDWASRVCDALEQAAVVQGFETVRHLTPGGASEQSGLIARWVRDEPLAGSTPGHAWAAHCDVLMRRRPSGSGELQNAALNISPPCDSLRFESPRCESPLFDSAIVGGADSLMAQAWTGRTGGAASELPPAVRDRFLAWAPSAWEAVRNRVAAVPGTIEHLWHGPPEVRHPTGRSGLLDGLDFGRDVAVDASGLWAWQVPRSPNSVRSRVEAYFDRRSQPDRPPAVATHLCNVAKRPNRPRRIEWSTARDRTLGFDWPSEIALVTYGNRPAAGPLEMQARRHGWPITVLGRDVADWQNVRKIDLLADYLRAATSPLVLACDGDDVLIGADPRAAAGELDRRRLDMLFAAESACYPPGDPMRAAQDAIARGRYLNSGQVMLRRSAARWVELARALPPSRIAASDQDRWQRLYVAHPDRLGIDAEERVFRVRSHRDADPADRRPAVTLAMLSWKRPAGVLHVLDQTLDHPHVSDAVVWNAGQPLPLAMLTAEKRSRVVEIRPSRDLGLRARWTSASLASEPLVLMQDDDHLLPPATIDGLIDAAAGSPDRLHGLEGRRPEVIARDPLRVRYHARPAYGAVPMLLGHGVLMPRRLAADLVAEEHRFTHATGGDPAHHGDDIFYSYASTRLLGQCPHAIDRPRLRLPAPHRLSGRREHRAARERLIADCTRYFRLE